MADIKKIGRLCPYNGHGSKINLKISTTPGMVAGAEFKLYKSASLQYLKFWKIGAQDGESASLELNVEPLLLNKHILTWQILICGKRIDVFDGTLTLEFFQDGNLLKTNTPTIWTFNNIPPCSVKQYEKFTESLVFVTKT